MSDTVQTRDGYKNVVANLSTSRDKASFGSYYHEQRSDYELANMYRSSAIARHVVDMPARDTVREWREWQADADQITAIDAEEKRLGVQRKLLEAKVNEGIVGGSMILIGTNEQNLERELVPDRISKGGVKFLSLIPRDAVSVHKMQQNPNRPGYNQPEMYAVSTEGMPVHIHPSRLVVFGGLRLPEVALGTVSNQWSGDSRLASCYDPVRNLDATIANVASLVFESKIDVFKIPDLINDMRDRGAEYEQYLTSWVKLNMVMKGTNGAIVMDADGDYQQKSASFAQLPEIMDRMMQLVAAAASVPVTLLFRISPGGMSATGESDTRGYYDAVKSHQTLEVGPAMSVLDECLIRSALGSRPEEIHYTWKSLWQETTKEKAETAKILGDAIASLASLGADNPEQLSEALINAFVESGAFPGIEGVLDKSVKPELGNDLDESLAGLESENDLDGDT